MRTIMTAVLLLVAALSPVQAEDGNGSVAAPPRFTMLLGFGTSIPGLGAGAYPLVTFGLGYTWRVQPKKP